MNKPVRTTIVFALASGAIAVPAAVLASSYWTWPVVFKLTLWADLALYALLLARWSRTALWRLVFPLAILLGTGLWPNVYWGFFVLAIGVLSWIRSGICFDGRPMRALFTEGLTITGAVLLLMFFGGHSTVAWALNICLFFLVQSLYFFFVPVKWACEQAQPAGDPFDRAVAGAQQLMDDLL